MYNNTIIFLRSFCSSNILSLWYIKRISSDKQSYFSLATILIIVTKLLLISLSFASMHYNLPSADNSYLDLAYQTFVGDQSEMTSFQFHYKNVLNFMLKDRYCYIHFGLVYQLAFLCCKAHLYVLVHDGACYQSKPHQFYIA